MAERGGKGRQRDPRAAYHAIEKRIRAAIEAGTMSREDARWRLGEFRKRLGERERSGKRRDLDGAALRKRLRAAIDAGRMTEEEARARFAEIMKRTRSEARGERRRRRL